MFAKDLLDLILKLKQEAKAKKNEELYEKLIEIYDGVDELRSENRQLTERLNLRYNITYNEDNTAFTINDSDNKVPYCSVCYGKDEKLIPITKGKCRVCEERWLEAHNKEH